MIKLLRLLQGFVVFEACSGFTERFLNLCKINNINLWNVKNDGVKVTAFTSEAEFLRIMIPAEKSGMEINVLKRRGLPFFVKTHKWRCGAVFGALAIVLLMWFISGFIWNVEIVSTNGVKIEGFTEKIEELGVKTGAKKSGIDILSVQRELLDSFSQLSWVSLNIFGTKAQIEYTYAKPQLPVADKSDLTNVVASKSGRVVLVEGYSGATVVKKGAYVTKGSLLISGVITNADLTESLVHASGKVFAETENVITSNNSHSQKGDLIESDKSVCFLNFFWFSIPLGKVPSSQLAVTTEMFLRGNGTVLPVGVVRVDTISAVEEDFTFSQEECKLKNLLLCVEEKRQSFGDVRLESVKYNTGQIGADGTVTVQIRCVENIAQEISLAIE